MDKVRLNIVISKTARSLLGEHPSQRIEDLILGTPFSHGGMQKNNTQEIINEIKYQADRILSSLNQEPETPPEATGSLTLGFNNEIMYEYVLVHNEGYLDTKAGTFDSEPEAYEFLTNKNISGAYDDFHIERRVKK